MASIRSLSSGWALAAAVLAAGCAAGSSHVADAPATAPLPAVPPPPPPAPVDVASWYGPWHHGRPTASGETYDMGALTAAHRSLPLGACVEVTHVANGRRVFVRVNDRGPYIAGRAIDLSRRAAEVLGMVEEGLARVLIRTTPRAACTS
jgi:rare lipoprotein A (peptidoglycan hydrolase)